MTLVNNDNREPTPLEKKMMKEAVEANRQEQRDINTRKYIWHSVATEVIKDKLEARKKLGLPNDWKIKFYEDKLAWKPKLLAKLAKLA